MRKLLISLFCCWMISTTYAKVFANKLEGTSGEIKSYENVSAQKDTVGVYRLYATQNMFTFIKLNTRNGQMWQVQYDVQGDNRFEVYLNFLPLVTKEKELNGRFILYSTQNIYTFILLDQFDGKMWQVQWSTESNNRGLIPIQ